MTYYCPNCHGYRPPRFVAPGKPRYCAECGGELMSLVELLDAFDDLLDACKHALSITDTIFKAYPELIYAENPNTSAMALYEHLQAAIAKAEPQP